MKQLLLLTAVTYLAASCAVSGATSSAAKPTSVSVHGKLQAPHGETAPPGTKATSDTDAGVPELNGLGFDPNLVGPRYNNANVEEPPSPDSMSDAQFEDAVEGLLEARAREQKKTEIASANEKSHPSEKSHPVRRVQTDGIIGYLWCNGMGVRECESGLVLDSGIGYRWHYLDEDYETVTLEVPPGVRSQLEGIIMRSGMFGRLQPAKPCPRDVGSQYLHVARHNVGRRLASCSNGEEHEMTYAGFGTMVKRLERLLGSDRTNDLKSHPINFSAMTQGVRDYLDKLPAGDLRKVQVSSWLDAVTGEMS